MKKLLVAVMLLCGAAFSANGQSRFVIKAGLDFSKMDDIKISNVEQSWNSQTGFHAGVGFQYKIPVIGLSFQPEVLYSQKRTSFLGEISESYDWDYVTNNIEVPINVQWGIDILFLRPFIFAAPYLSYAVSVGGNGPTADNWDDTNRFDYGLGLGAGLEIWKLQVTGKYNWGFGKPFNGIDTSTWQIKDANRKGFQLSVALLF